ncbi:hypothetical protein BIW11_14170 [Tropilaelaps mercedesae]|uniref:Uncharacterized protein n=1 Tax=Tropilaelaps mercedesae TaxID=418985 RepID=A0A1V9WYS5_9ACAR|nr:hypothetical protein BIW11_14170 [Tropilaelaps mercedesae]
MHELTTLPPKEVSTLKELSGQETPPYSGVDDQSWLLLVLIFVGIYLSYKVLSSVRETQYRSERPKDVTRAWNLSMRHTRITPLGSSDLCAARRWRINGGLVTQLCRRIFSTMNTWPTRKYDDALDVDILGQLSGTATQNGSILTICPFVRSCAVSLGH